MTHANSIRRKANMAKTDYIPTADNDFLIWFDHLLAKLQAGPAAYGFTESDLAPLRAASADFHAKIAHVNDTASAAKQAVTDKNDSRADAEANIRAIARRIKAHPDYTPGQGAHYGILGAEHSFDLATAKPDLAGVDQTGGVVNLSFTKHKSEGVNIYCRRENDADWVLLGRASRSPFTDTRPLLATDKPELRRYCAIYVVKDKEIGQFSDDLVINCAP
jgi:hypothetical protein